jgi:hypothetical protein
MLSSLAADGKAIITIARERPAEAGQRHLLEGYPRQLPEAALPSIATTVTLPA